MPPPCYLDNLKSRKPRNPQCGLYSMSHALHFLTKTNPPTDPKHQIYVAYIATTSTPAVSLASVIPKRRGGEYNDNFCFCHLKYRVATWGIMTRLSEYSVCNTRAEVKVVFAVTPGLELRLCRYSCCYTKLQTHILAHPCSSHIAKEKNARSRASLIIGPISRREGLKWGDGRDNLSEDHLW